MTKPSQSRLEGESLSLPFKDYPLTGEYFVTICTRDTIEHFGMIEHGRMQLSPVGIIAKEEWRKTPSVHSGVTLDAFVVMPSHIHSIVLTGKSGTGASKPASLGSMIGQFKCVSAKRIRDAGFRDFRWQPGYYEHVIRDNADLNRIRDYIVWNPVHWKPGTTLAEDIEMTAVHTKT
jgi:putative transposase